MSKIGMNEISKLLAEKLAIFTNDSSKRCFILNKKGNAYCKYSGTSLNIDAEGCLIGLFLSKEDRIKADINNVGSAIDLIRKAKDIEIVIPDWFYEVNEQLLNKFQSLHDIQKYWGENGLTNDGKNFLQDLITDFDLNSEAFENILSK